MILGLLQVEDLHVAAVSRVLWVVELVGDPEESHSWKWGSGYPSCLPGVMHSKSWMIRLIRLLETDSVLPLLSLEFVCSQLTDDNNKAHRFCITTLCAVNHVWVFIMKSRYFVPVWGLVYMSYNHSSKNNSETNPSAKLP